MSELTFWATQIDSDEEVLTKLYLGAYYALPWQYANSAGHGRV